MKDDGYINKKYIALIGREINMGKPKIKPVENNMMKRDTYKVLISKYKDAMDKECFGEAELIVYAFLEDRLRSFIFYSDGIDSWQDTKINSQLQNIIGGERLITNISSKTDIIKSLLNLSLEEGPISDYAVFIKKIYSACIDVPKFLKN